MRFRTSIEAVPTLLKVFQSIDKISDHCILNLSPTEVKIICTGGPDGVQVWTTLQKDRFFRDYRVESNYENMINLEVSTEMIISVLRTASDVSDVTMRLAKRGRDPLLSFSIVSMTHTGAKLELEHEVLIKLIKPPDWEQIREPHCPEPDVHIVLPRLLKLRTVAERMAKMSGQVAFSANLEGALNLSMGTDLAKVDTTWKGLGHPSIERDQDEELDDEEGSAQEDGGEGGDGNDSVPRKEKKKKKLKNGGRRKRSKAEMRSVTLEMRSFMRFLSSYNVETSTIACICVDHCAIFYVYIGDQEHAGGVMTFFIPGLIID